MVVPLTVDNTIIKDYPQHLIMSKQKLFKSSNFKNFVQKHSDIKEFKDDCIQPLVMGTKSYCDVIPKPETTMHLIAEDKLLIDNAKNEVISSDCGPSNRTLTGNFIISFWNCTITVNNKQFQTYEIRSETQDIQGALHNLQTIRNLVTSLNISLINQQNIKNREQISHMHLKQEDQQNWIWTLSGGLSFSSLGIIVLFIYIYILKRSTKVKIIGPRRSCAETLKEEDVKQCSKILREINMALKPKNEDVHSSPPGGVTLS